MVSCSGSIAVDSVGGWSEAPGDSRWSLGIRVTESGYNVLHRLRARVPSVTKGSYFVMKVSYEKEKVELTLMLREKLTII